MLRSRIFVCHLVGSVDEGSQDVICATVSRELTVKSTSKEVGRHLIIVECREGAAGLKMTVDYSRLVMDVEKSMVHRLW